MTSIIRLIVKLIRRWFYRYNMEQPTDRYLWIKDNGLNSEEFLLIKKDEMNFIKIKCDMFDKISKDYNKLKTENARYNKK